VFFFPTAKSKASLTQVTDFRDAYAAFQKAGFAVIGLAPDHHGDLEKLRVEHKLPYPLAEDVGSKVARKYGAYGPTHKYGITATLPDELHRLAPRVDGTLRSTFIIDADGVVAYVAARFTAMGHVFGLKKRLGVA
jgi:peroxiredoxin Q/BCP